MKIIGFCNLKGGVGKTTSCQNIACAFALKGKKVAVIDMDPQSNLSAGFGLIPKADEAQVFDLLSGTAEWDEVRRHKEGIDIIPGSLNLSLAELNSRSPVNHDTALKDALSKVDDSRYDYIFLDSPPQLGIFTRNVLTACEKILVPMDGGHYSLLGLKLLNDSIDLLHEHLNPELEITGILMTNYNSRLYIARQVYAEVQAKFGDKLFESYISQNVSLIEASRAGQSIFAYSPKSKAAVLYKEAAEELLERLEPHEEPETQTQTQTQSQTDNADTSQDNQVIEITTQNQNQNQTPEPPEPPEPVEIIGVDVDVIGGTDLKQRIIDMLDDSQKDTWLAMLGAVSEITQDELNIAALKEDFDSCDKNKYAFYALSDEKILVPVMDSGKLTDNIRLVLKWDDDGSINAFM
ncbi:MAG: ParA family protein [Synergistaceae bacterium]|nr:ParA family protein [Synergistaceae bacterium]